MLVSSGIDSTFDKHGVLSSVQDGHLADAVATRILQLMPPSHMVQLLLPVSSLGIIDGLNWLPGWDHRMKW
eukprot:scaffold301095_cov19-Tisochrysis_lutea.AAC.3